MSDASSPVLTVDGLRIETAAGEEILDGVSFELLPAEVLGLVGESGCGKTSTALALLGLAREGTRIASGSVVLAGHDLLRLRGEALRRARGARISYVPQDPTAGLNPRHRIGAQIAETLTVHGVERSEASEAVHDFVRRVRLPAERAFLRRYPFELSGGQQQRVAIAMALVAQPLVVVLDEPTTGLDVTTQAHVLDLLRELSRETRTAFVYVTHDLAVVDGLADRVAVMYAGRVVESGPRRRVFNRPAHPYTSLLLASVPRLSYRHRLTGIQGTAPAPGARPVGCFFAPRCPLADERCRKEFPPPVELEPGHLARCFHASEIVAGAPVKMLDEAAASTEPVAMLTVDDLAASYGKGVRRNPVLHGVSFSIADGECLALVGQSGSGKTTIGRCVVGLHRPDAGVVKVRGFTLAPTAAGRSDRERQAIQIVFQNPDRSLNPAQTVAEAILRPLQLFGLSERGAERRQIAELLERVRLPGRMLDRYPRELSGGERQRVAIARALAAAPELLVCDEITSALDVSIQAAVIAILEELRREGLALLFITHNLALVNTIADRVLVLEAGEVREEGETSQVVRSPRHGYTRELLAAAPELGAREESEETVTLSP
jgi:peptide/nickel transport system ATP-binding protein